MPNPNLKAGPGRPVGAKMIKSVRQMLDEKGFNPFHKAVEMILDADTPRGTRSSLIQSLFPYYGHRLNAIEITGKDGEPLVTGINVIFPIDEQKQES